jgi:SMODS and SLOG-associating 2TM effector domain 3/SMODS and SLOG-associating 2TM effector domain 1
MQLPNSALPGLFQAADQASVAAQRRFLLASRLRLGFLVLAAASGASPLLVDSRIDLAAVVTVVALSGAVAVEVWLLTEHPERTWYDGRALAESAKTLAWRFAVGGAPFGTPMDGPTAERELVDQLGRLLRDAPPSAIGPSSQPPVSDGMRLLRAADFEQRRAAYLAGRIDDQADWYRGKAEYNEKQSRRWRIALLVVESVGVLAALLKAIGVITLDLAGIVAAVAAAGVAWLSLKQHESIARAYSYAANELAIAGHRLRTVADETGWDIEVDNAEEAISREHTMWRASRSTL